MSYLVTLIGMLILIVLCVVFACDAEKKGHYGFTATFTGAAILSMLFLALETFKVLAGV